MKFIWVLIIWALIFALKYRRFVAFFEKLHSGSVPWWKAVAELLYKNPYFFIISASALYGIFIDQGVVVYYKDDWGLIIYNVMLISGLSYLVPVSVYLFFLNLGSRRDGSGSKEHVRGSKLTDEDMLSKALASAITDRSLPITQKIKIPS